MKNVLLPLLLLLFSNYLFAQEEFWQTAISAGAVGSNRNSTLITKDLTFVSISGKHFYEDTYFLESATQFQLPFEGSSFDGGYFYATEIQPAGSSFYFAAQRTGDNGDAIYLNTFNGTSPLTTGFEIPVTFESNFSKGPAAVKVDEENILIFANESFYKINLSENGDIDLEWTKDAGYGLIADAKPYNNGYILCNENEQLIFVDANTEEVWVKDLSYPLYTVQPLSDGFILGGEIDDQAALIKTDFNGNILWEKQYVTGEVLDITISPEGDFVFTGITAGNTLVVKTDETGEVIWTKIFDVGHGNVIKNVQFGGYLIQAKFALITKLIRLDEDGNSGPFLATGEQVKALEVNNIRTSASASGQLFWDGDDINTSFPNDSSTTTIFAGGLWLGASDQNGTVRTATTAYNNSDFTPGPKGGSFQSWNRVWNINKKFIERLREDLSDGQLDSAIPMDYWTYPGAFNPYFNLIGGGQDEVPQNMAPFIDVNNDGIYNILDGDYPDLKGDEMLWWIMHTTGDAAQLGGSTLELEARCVYYAYDCSASEALFNSAFLEIDLENSSDDTYSDLYLGTFIDFDIGCFLDDYMGTLPDVNAVFGYNSDDTDGQVDGSCPGVTSFEGASIPIQSVIYLNNDLDYSMHYINGAIGGPVTAGPDNPDELMNFLQGKWRDGTPQTEGGNGYGGIDPSAFAFPGNPSNSSQWSMCSEALSDSDRRMVMSSGPTVLMPQEVIEMDFGIRTHSGIELPCPDITQVESEIQELQSLYENGGLDVNLYLGPDRDLEPGESIILDAGTGGSSYNWSTGATSQTIEIDANGIYSVTVTTTAGCEYIDEVNIGGVISKVSDLQENAPKVYPNPATSQVFVELTNEVPQYITLEIA